MSTASSTLIYIGNMADLDPNESNYTVDNPTPLFRTFTEAEMSVTTINQTDANGDGQLQENDYGQTPDTFSYDLGSGPVSSGLDNAARYNVDYVDENGDTQSTEISAYQTENGDVFLRFPHGIKLQSVTIIDKASDGYASITHGATSSTQVVCFALGTMIDTPDGPRPIETLSVGDHVQTLDHGAQAIHWVHRARHSLDVADLDGKPILIKAGAIGPGRPARDLIVSPQHKILVGSDSQLQGWFHRAALAPAKSLTGLRGVQILNDETGITWVHIACERHEIIHANGCLTETLLLGPMVLNGLSVTKQRLLHDIYGPPAAPDRALNGLPARATLRVSVARREIARRKTHDQPVAVERDTLLT